MWGNHEDWMWGMGGLHMGRGMDIDSGSGRSRRLAARDGGLLALIVPALFEANLFVERVLQLVRSPFKLVDAAAERTAELRQFSGPENNERDHEDDDQLGHPDRTQHSRNP